MRELLPQPDRPTTARVFPAGICRIARWAKAANTQFALVYILESPNVFTQPMMNIHPLQDLDQKILGAQDCIQNEHLQNGWLAHFQQDQGPAQLRLLNQLSWVSYHTDGTWKSCLSMLAGSKVGENKGQWCFSVNSKYSKVAIGAAAISVAIPLCRCFPQS